MRGYTCPHYPILRKEQPRTMFTINPTKTNRGAERVQSDHLGRRLPLAGTDNQTPAAPFNGGCVS